MSAEALATPTFRLRIPMQDGKPILEPGSRMKQPEFHRRYLLCPRGTKFELVGGVVHMPSPLSLSHSDYDSELGFVLELYRRATPGTQILRNATAILSDESEPQPDLGLRILPEYGGRSRNTDDNKYVQGPPELLAEIAYSSRSIDMNAKRADYESAGVLEYIVVCVEEAELHWWHFPSGEAITPDRNGVSKSRGFPGLWLHVASILAHDSARVESVARQGLASRAHSTFVRKLEGMRPGE